MVPNCSNILADKPIFREVLLLGKRAFTVRDCANGES